MNPLPRPLLGILIVLATFTLGAAPPTTMPVEENWNITLRLYRPSEAANEDEPYPLVLEILNENPFGMAFPTSVTFAWREPIRLRRLKGPRLCLVVRPSPGQPEKPSVYLNPSLPDSNDIVTVGAGKRGLLRAEVPPEFLVADRKVIVAVLLIDGKVAAVSEPIDVTEDLGKRGI